MIVVCACDDGRMAAGGGPMQNVNGGRSAGVLLPLLVQRSINPFVAASRRTSRVLQDFRSHTSWILARTTTRAPAPTDSHRMPHYTAFLRAINITGHFVRMDHLRRLFEELGLDEVETYIQTGNVHFRTHERAMTKLTARIEARLEQELGFAVPAFLRSDNELCALANHEPFEALPGNVRVIHYVAFLRQHPDAERRRALMDCANDVDHLHVHENHIFWRRLPDAGKSLLSGSRIESALKMPTTVRNMSTILAMVERYGLA